MWSCRLLRLFREETSISQFSTLNFQLTWDPLPLRGLPLSGWRFWKWNDWWWREDKSVLNSQFSILNYKTVFSQIYNYFLAKHANLTSFFLILWSISDIFAPRDNILIMVKNFGMPFVLKWIIVKTKPMWSRRLLRLFREETSISQLSTLNFQLTWDPLPLRGLPLSGWRMGRSYRGASLLAIGSWLNIEIFSRLSTRGAKGILGLGRAFRGVKKRGERYHLVFNLLYL
jgi:hypothetical protein